MRRNRIWETLLLLLVTGILFRPGLLSRLLPIGDVAWTALGFALYAAIGIGQHLSQNNPTVKGTKT